MSQDNKIENSQIDRLGVAIQRLNSVRQIDGASHISTPLSYPNGSLVSLKIEFDPKANGGWFVSDSGSGFMEAEMSGASDLFQNHAQIACEHYGVNFDGFGIFHLRVADYQLEAAIVAVSNASKMAVEKTLEAAAEKIAKNKNAEIYDRLTTVFRERRFHREVEINGHISSWNAHNAVELGEGKFALFEYVTNHQNSISSKYLMFSDLQKTGESHKLNAVVKSARSTAPLIQAIRDVATVISIDATPEVFAQAA